MPESQDIQMSLKTWFNETRPPFLLLTPITYSVGIASAYIVGSFDVFRALLGLVGVLLAHISINVINDYFDYKSGLDFTTKPTPFSGGSGMLISGTLQAKDVYRFAMGSLIIGSAIGLYFAYTMGWMLLPLVAATAISIYFYTPAFSHWYVGEIITGINFGPLMVLGGYFIMTGQYSYNALAAGVIPGILVGTLLFLNEFPDMEADKGVGRKNVVISLGLEKASRIYVALIAATYAWVLICIATSLLPITTLVTFITLPTALKATRGVLQDHGDIGKLIPAMGANVTLTLNMTAWTTVGLLLSLLV
jgi:1,4-dihydroxy-2-naphthoate octaprenyltransferase